MTSPLHQPLEVKSDGAMEYALYGVWNMGLGDLAHVWSTLCDLWWPLRMESQTSFPCPSLLVTFSLQQGPEQESRQGWGCVCATADTKLKTKEKERQQGKGESHLSILWKRDLHFCFALDLANYLVGPVGSPAIPSVSPSRLNAFLWVCVDRRKIAPHFSCLPLPYVSKCFYWNF